MANQIREALLRLPVVCQTTGVSRATIYRLERDGLFPRRIVVSARCVAWKESEIQFWIESRQCKVG